MKPTPVPAAGDAAAASSAAVTGGNVPAAAPVAVPGTAKLAVAGEVQAGTGCTLVHVTVMASQ